MTSCFSISDHGADPSGTRLSTIAIQRAIDQASAANGGVVVVPPGRYLTGTIRLRSNIRLQLEPGATVVGSPDLDDYEEQNEGHVPPEFPYVRCLIVGFDLDNVEIAGGGTINGSGAAFMDYSRPTFDSIFTEEAFAAMPEEHRHEYVSEHSRRRPTWTFFFRRCRNVRFRDIRIVDVARWTVRFSRCENIQMRGLLIENDLRAANSDGMHFTSCRNVVVSDCVISSGDDCVAVTGYGDGDAVSRNTIISNCVLRSHSAGVRIGFNGDSLLEDVLIDNCIFTECNRGIGIFAGAGATVRHVAVRNVRVSTRLIAGTWWGKAEPLLITTLGAGALIEDVLIHGFSADSEQGIVMDTLPDAAVRDVTLTDVKLQVKVGPMSPFAAGTFDLRPRLMERRALPAFYARGIDDLTVRAMRIVIDDDARRFFGQPFEVGRCTDLRIEGIHCDPRDRTALSGAKLAERRQ